MYKLTRCTSRQLPLLATRMTEDNLNFSEHPVPRLSTCVSLSLSLSALKTKQGNRALKVLLAGAGSLIVGLFGQVGAALGTKDLPALQAAVHEMCVQPDRKGDYLKVEGDLDAGATFKIEGVQATGKITRETWDGINQRLDQYKTDPRECAIRMVGLLAPLLTTNAPSSAFFLLTGVDFSTLRPDLAKRIPNGGYTLDTKDRATTYYSYSHRLTLHPISPHVWLDLGVRLVIREERIEGAIADGTWSTYNDTCTELASTAQLISYLLGAWGRPYYSSGERSDMTTYFFRKEDVPIRVDVGRERDVAVWVDPVYSETCSVRFTLALPTSCPTRSDAPSLPPHYCG